MGISSPDASRLKPSPRLPIANLQASKVLPAGEREPVGRARPSIAASSILASSTLDTYTQITGPEVARDGETKSQTAN
jgi:hypothetical protein